MSLDLRAAIRAEVAAIAPLDAQEAEHRQAALDWIDSGAELWRRAKPATPLVHLSTYSALKDDAGLLLVDHRAAGLRLPAGGHAEPGEHPRDTVVRELFEELGVKGLPVPAAAFLTCTEVAGWPYRRDAMVCAADCALSAAAPWPGRSPRGALVRFRPVACRLRPASRALCRQTG